MTEFKFIAVPSPLVNVTEFYLLSYNGREQHYGAVKDNGTIIMRPFTECFQAEANNGPKPLFRVAGRLAGEVCKAMMEGLNKSGVPMPHESFLKGKLEATERHLQDMRVMALPGSVEKL